MVASATPLFHKTCSFWNEKRRGYGRHSEEGYMSAMDDTKWLARGIVLSVVRPAVTALVSCWRVQTLDIAL